MSTENCRHGHSAPWEVIENLHDSQAKAGRHKCCVCAYDEGYGIGRTQSVLPGGAPADECQQGLRAPREMLESLPDSQAYAEGRHRCAICAYHRGFEQARAEIIGNQVGDSVSKTVSDALTRPKG